MEGSPTMWLPQIIERINVHSTLYRKMDNMLSNFFPPVELCPSLETSLYGLLIITCGLTDFTS